MNETLIPRKLDFTRIGDYARDVWESYKHGKKIEPKSEGTNERKENHRSVFFLSKAGRFLTVGASGLLVNYAASLLFSNLVPNIWYVYATLFGIILSITSNFLLNKIWTFEDRNFSPVHFFRQYALFLGFCAIGAVVQLSVVYVLVESFGIFYALALVMAVCIASISNFLLNKKITFAEKIWE